MPKLKNKIFIATLLTCILFFSKIDFAENTWDLTLLYPSEDLFLDNLSELLAYELPLLSEYEGHLYDDAILLEFLALYESLAIKANRLHLYASLLADTDSRNTTYQGYKVQVLDAQTRLNVSSSFMKPEILLRSNEELEKIVENDAFKPYALFIKRLMHSRPHILSVNEEHLLALMTPIMAMPQEIYTHLTLSDARYNYFTNHKGRHAPFDLEWDPIYLYSDQAELRARTYETLYSPYVNNANTIATIYINEVLNNSFKAKARGYESAHAYALSGVMSTETYQTMIQSARNNVDLFQAYLTLKKNGIGLNTLKTSDLHLNYATEWHANIIYEDALKTIHQALQVLGAPYIDSLDYFLGQNTIDVYPNEFKTRSQYSWGHYDGPIYILLNYQDLFSDVTTLSHELGHAIHQSWLHKEQHFFDAQIQPFPGEIPAIVNELLVIEHFITHASSRDEMLAYNVHKLDLMMRTYFEQVMLAEFEMQIHEMADIGAALSLDTMNQVWLDIVAFYYGDIVEVEPFYAYHWMTIPHLYSSHYVYAYVMGLTAANSIVHQLYDNQDFLALYHAYLKSPTIDMPIESLISLNIDFDDASIYKTLHMEMKRLTQMIEAEIASPTFTPPERITLNTIEKVFKHYDVPYKDTDKPIPKWLLGYALALTFISISLYIYIRRTKKNLDA